MRAKSGSLRIDAPNSRRNDERSPTANWKYARKPGLDPLAARGRAARRLGEPVEEPAAGVVEQLAVERALAREVLVQHRLGDARRLRDVVHRRVVEARAREELARDGEELLAALVGGKAHRVRQTLDFNGMT